LENPEDNWKFSTGDLKERERWDDYMTYYEEAINNTNTDYAPWYVVPADDKGVARYIVAQTIWEKLESLTDITEPELDPKVKANIDVYREQLKG
jgi:polyphosphate kinase 2 (PPK2 family)